MPSPLRAPSRRVVFAPEGPTGQPGHVAVRARPDQDDEPKARALRPYAEKLITHAKKGALHNRREF